MTAGKGWAGMKKRYLCPLCEHELTAKSFCPECRKIRREPLVYEGGALPNERISESYTIGTDASRRNGFGTSDVYKNTRYPDTCGEKHTYGVPNKDPHKKNAAVNGKEQKSGTGGKILGRVIFIAALIFVIVLCWSPIKNTALDIWEAVGGPELFGEKSTPESAEKDDDYYSGEVSLEKILEEGEPCNGYNHYDVDGQTFVDTVSRYCSEVWIGTEAEVSEGGSSNRFYSYGDETYTYYENTVYIDLYDINAYITVVSDTVTGEVMEIYAYAEKEEDIMKLVLLACCGLEPEIDRNQIWTEVQDIFAQYEGDYTFIDWRTSELYISGEDGDYYMNMVCLDMYDKYQ